MFTRSTLTVIDCPSFGDCCKGAVAGRPDNSMGSRMTIKRTRKCFITLRIISLQEKWPRPGSGFPALWPFPILNPGHVPREHNRSSYSPTLSRAHHTSKSSLRLHRVSFRPVSLSQQKSCQPEFDADDRQERPI